MKAGRRRVAAPALVEAELDPTEVVPVVRVKRSRLAFALSITLAALPILVLDNLPASAARAEQGESATIELTTDPPAADAPLTTSTTAAPTPVAPAAPPEVTAPPATTPTTAAPAHKVAAVQAPPVTQAPAPPTTAPPAAAVKRGDPNDPASWDRMAQCEAGGNWSINSGNGYYGGLQFSLTTWHSFGGTGYPHQASKATQIAIGKKVQAAKGWAAWPGCARSLGFT